MKTLEFEIDSYIFLRVFRNRFKRDTICIKDVLVLGGQLYLFDHLEFLEPTVLESPTVPLTSSVFVPGGSASVFNQHAVLIRQPFRMNLVKKSDVAFGPPADLITGGAELLVRWDVKPSEDSSTLINAPKSELLRLDTSFDALPTGAAENIRETLTEALNGSNVLTEEVLDLADLENALKQELTVSNAGVVVGTNTTDGSSVIIHRIEFDGPYADSFSAWEAFYQTNATKKAIGTNNWSVLISKELLIATFEKKFKKGLDDSAAEGTFLPSSDPVGTWRPDLPGFTIEFSGELPGEKACPVPDIDVDIDMTMDVTLVMGDTNQLLVNIKLFWELDDGEVFVCSLFGVTLWPIVGTIFWANGELEWYEWLLGTLFGNIMLAGFWVSIGVYSGEEPELEEIGLTEAKTDLTEITDLGDDNADLEVSAKLQIELGNDLGFNLSFTSMQISDRGMLLSGVIPPLIQETQHPAVLAINGVFPFTWGGVKCGDATATASLTYTNTLAGAPRSELSVCHFMAVDDPLNQFAKAHFFHDPIAGTITILLNFSEMKEEYLEEVYPLRLVLISNGGARRVQLWMPQPSQEMLDKITASKAVSEADPDCSNILYHAWVGGQFFNPLWHVDPPPDAITSNLWAIVDTGKASLITVSDGKGKSLGRLQKSRTSTAVMVVETIGETQLHVNIEAGKT